MYRRDRRQNLAYVIKSNMEEVTIYTSVDYTYKTSDISLNIHSNPKQDWAHKKMRETEGEAVQ